MDEWRSRSRRGGPVRPVQPLHAAGLQHDIVKPVSKVVLKPGNTAEYQCFQISCGQTCQRIAIAMEVTNNGMSNVRNGIEKMKKKQNPRELSMEMMRME